MTDTKGNIRARKLGNTGITEDILKKIADAKGGHLLAIVELKADEVHEKVDGDDRKVDFIIDTIEPVVDGKLDGTIVDHVRNIQAALFRNRKLADGDQPLPYEGDGPEPSVKDVLAQGAGLVTVDDDGEPQLWDGNTDPDEQDEQEDESADRDNPAYEPHAYVDTAHAVCGYYDCRQPAGATIHDQETLEQDEDDVA